MGKTKTTCSDIRKKNWKTLCKYHLPITSNDDRELFFCRGSAVDDLAILEGEGHAAIGVDRGVVQQACPETIAEGGHLILLLLQELQEILHCSFPRLHVADVVGDLAVLLLGCVEALTQVVEAFLVGNCCFTIILIAGTKAASLDR